MLSVLREHEKVGLNLMLTEYREHATREVILGLILSQTQSFANSPRIGFLTMSMVWTVLFALVAETGGHSQPSGADLARPVIDGTIQAKALTPWRSLSIARKGWHRACPGHWSWTGLEEFDTEEVDETWMVDLDTVTNLPGSWLRLAWSRSTSESKVASGLDHPARSYSPLRC